MLDLVYPPGLYCICCGKIIDDSRTYRLCNDCMRSMNWNTGRCCSRCGRPLADTDPGEKCFGCRYYGWYNLSGDLEAAKYALRMELDWWEDRGKPVVLSEYGADGLTAMYDIVTPVPVHADKLKKRGFNHAELIGRGFANRAGLRFDPGMIVRTRGTVPMKGLGPEERRANIRGAFDIRNSRLPQIEGARILLTDDIFTTGSTIDEIASLLKYHGASRVDFIAFSAAGDMVI